MPALTKKKKKGQRWTKHEHALYIEAIRELGISITPASGAKVNDWVAVHGYVVTRSPTQCKTHHQKVVKRYLASLDDSGSLMDEDARTEHSLRELAGIWMPRIEEPLRAVLNESGSVFEEADSLLDWDLLTDSDTDSVIWSTPLAIDADIQAAALPM